MFYPINIKSLKKKCVLITGSHRSGSTWIGKIMALSRELHYIHEPFNVAKHKKAPFSNWFQYYDAKSSDFEEQEQVLRYLKAFHKPSLRRLFNRIRRAKYPGQVRDALVKEWACIAKQPLYKDPIAFMSAEWFYENMDAYIVISVRHPAAFVASLKVKYWH